MDDSNNNNNNSNVTTTTTATTLEQQQQQQPAKISFTLNSNSTNAHTNAVKRKVLKEEDDDKDFIKDVIGGTITSVQERTSNQPLVIPLGNQAHNKPVKVRKTLPSIEELMQNNGEVKLEKVIEGDEHSAHKGDIKEEIGTIIISADEIKRELIQLKKDGDEERDRDEKREEKKSQILPILLQNRIEGMEDFKDDVEKFKYDLSIRPNEPDIESYDSVPIEDFGQAMLRGMGWTPNTKKDEPLEYVKRPGFRLGLGATPKAPEIQHKKYIKPGESREPAPILVAPRGSDGRVRNVKSIHEELVPMRIGVQKGGMVIILEGPHDGLYGKVLSVNGSDLVVRLQASSEEVEVSLGDVKPIDDNHPMAKSMKKDDNHHKHHHHEHNDHHHKKDDKHHKHHHSEKKSSDIDRKNDAFEEKNNWLCPNILVKMVSKSFKDGQYYNKRAKVVDVLGAGLCVVQLDDGRLVDGVHQRMVETSIPRSKEKVLVVQGKDKGRVGILLERVKDDKKEEVGVVQLSGDLSVKNYPLDNIAHYFGDEEDDIVCT